jgi:hypothetical protein
MLGMSSSMHTALGFLVIANIEKSKTNFRRVRNDKLQKYAYYFQNMCLLSLSSRNNPRIDDSY